MTGPAAARLDLGEIEDGIALPGLLSVCKDAVPPTTSIDLLEMAKITRPQWREGLDHEALLQWSAGRSVSEEDASGPSLCLLLLNTAPTAGENRTVLANPSTLKFLHSHFGVSLSFLDCLGPIQWGAPSGNACYDQCDEDGTVNALYHFITERCLCDVWFSHQRRTQRTTYIISNCAANARARILQCAFSNEHPALLRPMMIDAFLADAASESLKSTLQAARARLLQYEHPGVSGVSRIPPKLFPQIFQSLHQLSKTWHILYENLINHEEALAFILKVHDVHIQSAYPRPPLTCDGVSSKPNHDAMHFLSTRNTVWKRWVGNYNARTQIRINLYFNLASQGDNKTNLEIARTSRKIAEATLRDSSSMITIATMTMLFLPSTFVSAVLSMAFFTNGSDEAGRPILAVLPQWWIFPATTIPLKALVFIIWRVWQRKRLAQDVHTRKEEEKGDGKIEHDFMELEAAPSSEFAPNPERSGSFGFSIGYWPRLRMPNTHSIT